MRIAAGIVSYRISNGALSAKDLPTRLKVLDWGDNPSAKGTVRVNAMTAGQLPEIQRAKRWDRIALDYEHNSLPGTPEFERSPEPKAVAAYGSIVCVAGDGLYLDDLVWTPHGEKFAREYCDLSPAPMQTADGTVVGVHSVALCRHGAVDGLEFYSVELTDEKERAMDWKAFVLKFLGMADGAKDEEIQAGFGAKITALCVEAVKPVAEALDTLKTSVTALSAEDGGAGAAAVAIAAAEGKITALSADVDALKGEMVKRDRAELCAQACREGKVIPLSAELIAKTPVEDLREIVGKLPVTVPIERRTPEHVEALSADTPSDALDRVARQCGMDPKTVLDANKA